MLTGLLVLKRESCSAVSKHTGLLEYHVNRLWPLQLLKVAGFTTQSASSCGHCCPLPWAAVVMAAKAGNCPE
uniref:Uncharacterized protein n=1 Tax=Arundo donax TaxID=35708 RepID=A0A0A8YWC0_ARUDO